MQLPKGRVMLIADQGFGDTIQFCRYIPMVAACCAEVVLCCAQDLRGLMATVPGVGRTFNGWREIPGFSAYNLLSSLPFVFGTAAGSIPATIPYLTPDPAKVEVWQNWCNAHCAPEARRIGFFWSGRPSHPNNVRRSMRLSQFRQIAELPGVQMISLQKDVPASEVAELAAFPNTLLCANRLGDFGDTAALIATLDLVITIDSAVAHLAGALGVPVWLLTPKPADWRWLQDRTDTEWYPSMRLFRQPVPGDWAAVLTDVTAAISSATPGVSRACSASELQRMPRNLLYDPL